MDDLISRQAAIDTTWEESHYTDPLNVLTEVRDRIKALPSAQPEPLIINIDNELTEEDYKKLKQEIADSPVVLLPSAQPESLTDKEQRIFLAAMGREEKVCKQVDDECRDCREPYEDSLVRTCHEIIRKVKGALWT